MSRRRQGVHNEHFFCMGKQGVEASLSIEQGVHNEHLCRQSDNELGKLCPVGGSDAFEVGVYRGRQNSYVNRTRYLQGQGMALV